MRLRTQEFRRWGKDRDAKIAEQDFIMRTQQQILRLHIAMNHMVAVCIVQGGGGLVDSGDDGRERQTGTGRVALSHSSLGGIVHDEDRRILLDGKIKNATIAGYTGRARVCASARNCSLSVSSSEACKTLRAAKLLR